MRNSCYERFSKLCKIRFSKTVESLCRVKLFLEDERESLVIRSLGLLRGETCFKMSMSMLSLDMKVKIIRVSKNHSTQITLKVCWRTDRMHYHKCVCEDMVVQVCVCLRSVVTQSAGICGYSCVPVEDMCLHCSVQRGREVAIVMV